MVRHAAAVTAGPKPPRRQHGRTPAELLANAASAHRVTAADLDLSGVTVLIVEDHADSRDMLRQIVESFGAKVALAADGREALRHGGMVATATCPL